MIVKAFLDEAGVTGAEVKAACMAVAGPVNHNEVTMTNRGKWVINGDKVGLRAKLGGGKRGCPCGPWGDTVDLYYLTDSSFLLFGGMVVALRQRVNWSIQLAKATGIGAVELVNDFVALGYGLLTVDRNNPKEVKVLHVSTRFFVVVIYCWLDPPT